MNEKLREARAVLVSLFPYLRPVYRVRIVPSEKVPTMAATDKGRILYNPQFVDLLSPVHLVGVLWHEYTHIARHVGTSRVEALTQAYGPLITNWGLDLEINDDLEDLGLQAPRGDHPYAGLFPQDLGLPRGLLAEEYIELLKNQPPKGAGSGLPSGEDGKDGKGQGNGFDEPFLEEEGDGEEEDAGMGPAELEIFRREFAQAVLEEAQKGRGTVPAGLLRWAKELLHPQVDWRSVLRYTLRRSIQNLQGRRRPTYARPHRRQASLGKVLLPGSYGLAPRVGVIVDTSGSMSEDDLSQALGEVRGILRATRTAVRVYSVDSDVHKVQRVFRPEEVVLYGGGGTDMGVGIEKAARDRPKPDLIVVLTDGYTPWPERVPIPTLAVIIGNGPAPEGIPSVRVGGER